MEGLQTGEESDLHVKGLFYAVGHKPNTSLFKGQLELDDVGYIVTKPGSVETSVEGVYAAGDARPRVSSGNTAAGTGCMAAMLAERWLSSNGLIQEFHQAPETPDNGGASASPEKQKPSLRRSLM